MKRISLLILLLFFIVPVFAQEEVWGFQSFGGEIGGGLVFKLDLENNVAQTTHRFDFTTGYKGYVDSNNPLIDGGNGLLYSTAAIRDLNQNYGSQNMLFSYNPESNEMNLVSDILDYARIVFADTENHLIYFWNDGSSVSKISKYDIDNNEFSIVQEYDETFGTDISGNWTEVDGKYYFFNEYGGAYHSGTFLEFDPASNEINKIIDFEEINFPQGSLMVHPNGFYYGVTKRGGESNKGCIYKLDPKGGGYEVLIEFNEEVGSPPNGDFILANDGCIYGFTKVLGAHGKGSIIKYTPETNKLEAVYYFDPESPFMEDHQRVYRLSYDGNNKIFFSTEPNETTDHKGFLMSFNIETLEMEMLVNYNETSASYAVPRLTFYGDRILGFARDESNNGYAGVFEIPSQSDEIEFLNHVYIIESAEEGYNPIWMCQAGDGDIYGMTKYGGEDDKGVLFSIDYYTHEFHKLRDLTDYGYEISIRDEAFLLDNGNILGFMAKKEDDVWSHLKAVEFNPLNLEFKEVFSFPDSTRPRYNIRMNSNGNLYYASGSPVYSIYELELESYTFSKIDIGTDSVIRNICEGNSGIYYGMTNRNIFKWDRTENEIDYIFNNNYFGNDGVGSFQNDIYVTKDERLFGAVYQFDYKSGWLNSFTYFISYDSVSEHSYLGNDFNVTSLKSYMEIDEQDLIILNHFNSESIQILDLNSNQTSSVLLESCPYESGWVYFTWDGWEYDGGDAPFQNTPGTGLISVMPKENKYYWTGNQDSLWFNENNWHKGKLPEGDEQIVISGSAENYPYLDFLLEVSDLYIQKGAQITIAPNGALTCYQLSNSGLIKLYGNDINRGSLIFEEFDEKGKIQYVYQSEAKEEKLLALPVNETSYSSFDSLNIWNYQSDHWQQIQDTSALLDCHHIYKFAADTAKPIQFSGDAITENMEFSFAESGLQAIPNPYTASLNWDDLNLYNLSHQALYRFIEEDSSFVSYVDGLGSSTPLVQPLDVVWVMAASNESVELSVEDRMHAFSFNSSLDTTFKELVIKVEGEGGSDFTHIRFNPKATAAFDERLDAYKIFITNNERPLVFTYAEDDLLSINQLPDTTMLDMGVLGEYNTSFKLSIDENINFDFVVLEDLILNTKTDLLQEDYSFDYFTSDGNYPFKLYFKDWVLQPLEEADVEIYYYPESVVVRSKKQVDVAEITFFDLAGRVAEQYVARNFFVFEKPVDLPTGHYIVQLRTSDLVVNKKILVRK